MVRKLNVDFPLLSVGPASYADERSFVLSSESCVYFQWFDALLFNFLNFRQILPMLPAAAIAVF